MSLEKKIFFSVIWNGIFFLEKTLIVLCSRVATPMLLVYFNIIVVGRGMLCIYILAVYYMFILYTHQKKNTNQ